MTEEELQDAPPPVREAANWLEAHRWHRTMAMLVTAGSMGTGVLGTAIAHDVYGIGGLIGGAPLIGGMLVATGAAVWMATGPLKHLAAKAALVQRYKALREMGLALAAPAAHREDRSAVDRLVDRIHALSEDPEVLAAVRTAQERATRLETELSHLDSTLTADPDLAEQLSGVRERVETEVSRIRARLAETWAALIELDATADGAEADLRDALQRLSADLEVREQSDVQRTRARAARSTSASS